ncbi:uncharacterized protein LOC117123361 [Anneissia japonica]|uniref:uncharacterized protein LOC117123361 n=1 Tax=Anneissia japonica TaxID=1529436 RepID=UPI001425A8D7|nr:uncharacterized protein LOC117123361 [Anneissia japonica]XP_033125137.1 uncharacterized protein LOC117123361 [Anneissia japonica]
MSTQKGLNNEEESTEENGLEEKPVGKEFKCSTECQEDMQFDSVLNLGQLPEEASGFSTVVNTTVAFEDAFDIRPPEKTPTPSHIFQLMHNYGPQIVPNDIRNEMWTATKADLQEMISNGLIPQDTMDSAGIDPESYEHFMDCVTEIREKIWEEELRTALSILRGARRIFSASNDADLRHVFCGPPIEVLADIYYDGIGVLPKNQMTEDPFHHSLFSDRLFDEQDRSQDFRWGGAF